MTDSIRLLVYGHQGAAQFQMVAGSTAGLRAGQEEKLRSLAAGAAGDAARSHFPAGRAARIGPAECYAVAIPTGVREAMSGRGGLGVSFVILSRGMGRTEPEVLVQMLAGMELALSAALATTSVDIRQGAEVLAQRLQGDEATATGQALTSHIEDTERILDAVARERRPMFRRHIPAGATFNMSPTRVEFCLLATLIRGLRSTRGAQQGLILRLGQPVPPLSAMRAHQFLYNLVVFSQDAPPEPR